jgi:uncharacterized membrane protein YtjA (UPF0391 family)
VCVGEEKPNSWHGRGRLTTNVIVREVSECAVEETPREKENIMLSWSITFLVIGLIAGLLGLSGIAGAATQIAWVLFVVFLVLFLVSLVMGRRSPPV